MKLDAMQHRMLAELVAIRHDARCWVKTYQKGRDSMKGLQARRDVLTACGQASAVEVIDSLMAEVREHQVTVNFHLIRVGRTFMEQAPVFADHLPRAAWLEALSVNRAEWDTDLMRQHGDDPGKVACVLGLENSATRDDGIEVRPLNWCYTMALMNAMKTSNKMDRAIHEASNEFFGGAFGEYRERSPLERMGIPAHMIQGGD